MNAPKSFKIAARAILELGAELISSDGIALYELLKNAVDAGSEHVRIEVFVSLKLSAYITLIDRIDRDIEAVDAFEGTDAEQMRMIREAISENQRHIFEALEPNAPEQCRTLCSRLIDDRSELKSLRRSLERFYDRANWITIADTGEGMSLYDLGEVYLTIGTRSRQRVKAAAGGSKPARVFLGEKGVGRLSTMRLGGLLRVETAIMTDDYFNRLDIDWDWFSHNSEKMLGDIRISPRTTNLRTMNKSGTTVTIMRLRSDWSKEKFAAIVLEEFSKLIDPFEGRKASRLLRLFYNGARSHVPEIERHLFEIAHAECKANFAYEDGGPVLRGYVNYRLRGRDRTFVLREPELRGAIGKSLPWGAVLGLGPFDVSFWWYNRAALTDVAGIGKKRDLQARVRRWAGGLMLFRDGFRINPYGGPDDDWLGLDKRAFSSRGFKLNRQQVIGAANISWRNPKLVEQTNREGLTDTPEKLVFVALLQQILFKEFKTFLDKCDTEVRVQEELTLEDLQQKVERAQDDIVKKIREVVVRVPTEQEPLSEVERLVKTLNGYVDQARELAQEYETDRAKFTYLAGIGLMVEFILHELGRATAHTLDTLKSLEAGVATGDPHKLLPSMFRVLDDQLTTIVKRVETLDPLSTSRRQRKEDFNVVDVLQQIVDGRRDQARRHHVDISANLSPADGFRIRGVRGMFIQIIENLLSNSFHWLSVQRDIEPGLRPYIEIDVDPAAKTVTVTDNGPGVDPAASVEIFDAFVSHRPARDGKGLGLYISREIAGYHDWTLDVVRENTVRKGRYNSFVLDLSATAY